jgi:ketosteroid isomerase-like protein
MTKTAGDRNGALMMSNESNAPHRTAFEGPIEDRLLIRERIGAYSDATCRRDVDAWLACWTESGIRVQAGAEHQGKAALRSMWEKVWRHLDKMAFFAEIGTTQVQGDRAVARCYCREILFLKGGAMRKVVGIYHDELVRENGYWLFAGGNTSSSWTKASQIANN